MKYAFGFLLALVFILGILSMLLNAAARAEEHFYAPRAQAETSVQ